jgi:tetratricopeptide (TPR) repeat protein
LDSTFYAAAEALFAAGKYDKAKQAFGQYLQQYPNGAFAVKANYYKAESHYQLKEYKEALSSYDAVLNNGWSDFTENSARRASALAYQNGDYAAATKYYGILRTSAMGKEDLQTAYSGLTRASFNTGNYTAAGQYADTLLSMPEVSDNLAAEARFYKARSLQVQQNDAAALALYQQVTGVKDAAMAAESRYRIAEIYFKQGNLKESETAAGETIKQGGNDYWVVKSYILLADILTKQKDYFNAKATLQSIIKNTKNQELKTEAGKKLEEVKALEKKQSKLTEE